MIIKIKQGAVDQVSWRYHDSAHEVSYAVVFSSCIPKINDVEITSQMGIQFEGDDGVVRETHFIEEVIGETCLCISFIDFNGKAHEIYTDATTYLLNDNGKTVERIY